MTIKEKANFFIIYIGFYILPIILLLNEKNIPQISLNKNAITDYENNIIDSTINIPVPDIDKNIKKYGSLKGYIQYNGKMDIVVKLTNIETQEAYFVLANDNQFTFKKISPGQYSLDSYENKHNNIEIYYSGTWNPFNKAAKIVQYPDIIDIRAHWEVSGVKVHYVK